MGDTSTPAADPAAPKSEPAAKAPEPEKLPDDHPLVTALAAQKQKNADLQKQLDEAKATKPEPKAADEPKPAEKPADDDLAAQLAELQAKVDKAEAERAEAQTIALRTRLAAGKIPAPLITKLTGTTEDEINTEIDEITPLLKAGPAPNPQQGQPSQGAGGSLAAGRDRYQQSHT